jgi:hypothetical protein
LDRAPVAARREVNEIRDIPRGDPQTERVARDGGAVEKLRVRPHRGDGRHLIYGHLRRWGRTDNGQEHRVRVVSDSFVGRRFAAGCHDI